MTTYQSSEKIRQEIQSTRLDMSETIDAIQEQLDPNNLKQQAQEAIRDTVSSGADAIVDYVRTNRSELSSTFVDTVKRNPVPTALVGLGLGWLLIENLTGNSSNGWSRNNVDYPIERYRDDIYAPKSGYGQPYTSQKEGEWANLGFETHSPNQSYRSASENNEEDWMRESANNLQRKVSSAAEAAKYRASGLYETKKDSASSAADSLEKTASTIGDKVQNTVATVTDRVQDVVENVVDQVQMTAEQARSKAEHWSDRAGHQASQIQEQAGYYTDQTGRYAQQYVDQSGRYVQRSGAKMHRTINDNPLVFGAAALGIGALIAALLPETRRENEWMGETRDELMNTAHSAVQDVAQRAQKVVDEVAPDVQQSVEKIVEDVKQTSKEAAEEFKKTGVAAAEEVKKTGMAAAKEVKKSAENAAAVVKTESKKAKDDLTDRAQEAKETVEFNAS